MIYQKHGEIFQDGDKTFTIGGEVYANHESDYHGLFGVVSEILTEEDRDTENETPDIYCSFQMPEGECMIRHMEERFSSLYGEERTLEELGLDCVIMAPSMLEPIPAKILCEGKDAYVLSLRCDCDEDSDSGIMAVSFDKGALLRLIMDDLEGRKKPMVLAHVQESEDELTFQYEAKETGVEDLCLCYTITRTTAAQARKTEVA